MEVYYKDLTEDKKRMVYNRFLRLRNYDTLEGFGKMNSHTVVDSDTLEILEVSWSQILTKC